MNINEALFSAFVAASFFLVCRSGHLKRRALFDRFIAAVRTRTVCTKRIMAEEKDGDRSTVVLGIFEEQRFVCTEKYVDGAKQPIYDLAICDMSDLTLVPPVSFGAGSSGEAKDGRTLKDLFPKLLDRARQRAEFDKDSNP